MSSLPCGPCPPGKPRLGDVVCPQEPQLQDDLTSRGVFTVYSQVSNKKERMNTCTNVKAITKGQMFCDSVYTVSRIGKPLETEQTGDEMF